MSSPKDRLILPLDGPSLTDAMSVIKELKDHVGLFKVGLTLFVNEGRHALDAIGTEVGGDRIFLDLKFLDIPETVRSVSEALNAQGHGVKFVTVHASGGEKPLRAAVEGVSRGPHGTRVIAVTVLTSFSEPEFRLMKYTQTSIQERVLLLAEFAKHAGAAGVVCSGFEVREIKERFGDDFLTITPGIRPAWGRVLHDDQRRIMTPGDAIKAGADYLVVGRSIIHSANRVEAAKRVVEEIDAALASRPAFR